jgi:protein-S-isoprenylcysteine O-methyltransferase Ste14
MLALIPKLPLVLELDEGEGLFTATSKVLITHGPLVYSRIPMFLADKCMLLGWAIFYGSVVFLVPSVAGWALLHYLKVPQE